MVETKDVWNDCMDLTLESYLMGRYQLLLLHLRLIVGTMLIYLASGAWTNLNFADSNALVLWLEVMAGRVGVLSLWTADEG